MSVESRFHKEPDVVLSPWIKHVSYLHGYSDTDGILEPKYGDTVGVWNAITGRSVLFYEARDIWKRFLSGDLRGHAVGMENEEMFMRVRYGLENLGILSKNSQDQLWNLSVKNSHAEVYFQTTQACNLACSGCAVGSDKAVSEQLSSQEMAMYIETCVRSAKEKGYSSLNIKWAGGEALLPSSFRKIVESQDYILTQARLQDIEVTQTLLTNGTFLTDKVADWLKAHDIETVISFWGVGELNDLARSPRNGKESFPPVLSAIRRCYEKDVKFNVLTVLGPDTAEGFADTVKFLWDPENEHFALSGLAVKEPLKLAINFFRPQSSEQYASFQQGTSRMLNGIRKGFAEIVHLLDRGVAVSLPDRWDYLNLRAAVGSACGSGFNYIAIGPNGVTSCHEGLVENHDTMNRVLRGDNVFDIAASEYEDRSALAGDRVEYETVEQTMLATHGGAACPRARIAEHGDLTKVTEMTRFYESISTELLALFARSIMESDEEREVLGYAYSAIACSGCKDTRDSSCGTHEIQEHFKDFLRDHSVTIPAFIGFLKSLGYVESQLHTEVADGQPYHVHVDCIHTDGTYFLPDNEDLGAFALSARVAEKQAFLVY